MFSQVLRLMADELQGIDVDTEVRPRTLAVHADPALLDQVLVNLLRNAVQAMEGRDGRKLSLVARLDFGRTLIQLRDNGPGIDPAIVDQIFVPFFTTRRDGSGIGLSVSRQIMLAHGGDLVASSDESYEPGYSTKGSRRSASMSDMKRGYA